MAPDRSSHSCTHRADMCPDGVAHHSKRERLLRAERNRSGGTQEGGS